MAQVTAESRVEPRSPPASPVNGSAASPAGDGHAPVRDVWSRSDPRYRKRAIVLLALNLLLYCGLCIFTHWLHFAKPFDFSIESYMAPARFWGAGTQNLNDFILYPISVEQTPVHGVVLGLLVASIVAVPILISILYGFLYSLPLSVSVLIFAHMPWMAMTLVISTVLASVRPFRFTFRFGSALLGMVPVLIYLFLATRSSGEDFVGIASPVQRTLLAAPWVLAILAACLMMAAVLLIARFVRYRPGAVAPVVAVMFATPVVLFHARVGVDELRYRVLEYDCGPHSRRFEPVEPEAVTERIRALIHDLTTDGPLAGPYREDLLAVWAGEVDPLKRHVWHRMLVEFLADRAAAYQASRDFIADHPQSRYAPNALYIQARAMDTRLDERKLHDNPPQRELYVDFPHVQSEPAWGALWNEHPESRLSIAAGLRLAQLHLRRGEVNEAESLLIELKRRAALLHRDAASTQPSRGLLKAAPPESSLEFEPDPFYVEACRLLEVVQSNRVDPEFHAEPLRAWASLDERRPRYSEQLRRLADTYRNSPLHDNIVVRWAGSLPDPQQRAARLAECLDQFSGGDARAEAMFRLADLEIQALGDNESLRQQGIARMRKVAEEFPDSCWAAEAAGRLRMVDPRTTTRASPAVPN